MPGPADIAATAQRLDDLVSRLRARRSPVGYFAAMYRQTTRAVGEAVEAGVFDDGARMAGLVDAFAGRYLEAVATWEAGGRPTRSWAAAFDAAGRRRHLILQHLVLGINAHVNLDLAIAAALTGAGDMASLEADFDRINALLASLTDAVQDAVGRFSPLLGTFWRAFDGPDDIVLGFSFRVAREEAWRRALTLARLPSSAWPPAVASIDRAVALVARLVAEPRGLARMAASVVAATESRDVVGVIDALGTVRA